MKLRVLAATAETQGRRRNDFFWTTEGELVGPLLMECSSGTIDDACGCRRGLGGLTTHKVTTTVKVIEVEMTMDEYAAAIRSSHLAGGWAETVVTERLVQQHAAEMLAVAARYEVGTVLERRGSEFNVRAGASEEGSPAEGRGGRYRG